MTRGDDSLQMGYLNSKENWPPGDRSYMNIPSDVRMPMPVTQPQNPHPRTQTIANALRDCAGIGVKDWALIAIMDNGENLTFASPELASFHEKIFTDGFKSTFARTVRRATTDRSPGGTSFGPEGGMFNHFELDAGNETRNSGTSSSDSSRGLRKNSRIDEVDDDASGASKRARRRYGTRCRENPSDDAPPSVPTRRTQVLEIGNTKQVEEFYSTRFKDMQQTACKTLGKLFVKTVEPKKQTNHPYTRGDGSAPHWWPVQQGDDYVRHREPDHLYKKERIRLLVHILRMVVQPVEKQHPSVQKVGLTIRILEEKSIEAMSPFFSDIQHPDNKIKKAYLKEIFKVAKMEERLLREEIDGSTKVPVMFGDDVKDEESEDEGLQYDTPPEGLDEEVDHKSMGNCLPTPESMPLVSPPMSQNEQIHVGHPEPMRLQQLPHRYHSQTLQNQQQFSEPTFFSRNIDSFHQPGIMPNPLRRSFSSTDYHSQSTLAWQPQTLAGNTNSYYSHVSVAPSPSPLFQMTQTLPPPSIISPHQNPHFDGLPSPSGRYDSTNGPVPGTQYRTGSLDSSHQIHPQGFDYTMQDNNAAFNHNGDVIKDEGRPQHQLQHHH